MNQGRAHLQSNVVSQRDYHRSGGLFSVIRPSLLASPSFYWISSICQRERGKRKTKLGKQLVLGLLHDFCSRWTHPITNSFMHTDHFPLVCFMWLMMWAKVKGTSSIQDEGDGECTGPKIITSPRLRETGWKNCVHLPSMGEHTAN